MKILIIAAHADDETIAMGGSIAKFRKQGHEVKVVIMTDSTYTNYDGTILRTYSQVVDEFVKCMEILNVVDYQILKFSTKDIPYDSTVVEAINQILDEFKPDKIFTHFYADTHQAHKNVALSTISATRNYNDIYFFESFPPSGRSYIPFKTQLYIDISNTIDIKLEALKAHQSQYQKYGEEWIDATKARAKLRGFESNHKYSECFEILREEL